MKTLIVTADDVGLHAGMTDGAIQGFRHGIVTACSVCACGPAFDHAVSALREAPGLDVGAHLMLVEGHPVLPASRTRSLVAPSGAFHPDHRVFVARYVTGRIAPSDVEAELRAQLERLRAAGLRLVHLNSHQHLHMLPGIFAIAVRLAREFAIPYVRIVRDHGGGGGAIRRASIAALNVLGRMARPDGLRSSDRTIGVADAGHLTRATLVRLLAHVDGVTELVTHPGVGGAQLARTYPWHYEWDAETAALCDPSVRRAIAERGIGVGRVRT